MTNPTDLPALEAELGDGDDFDDFEMDCCSNCGGEGYVADCFEEYACVDPESGCELCMRRCDFCNRLALKAGANGQEG